ncbi:MAG: protein-L-isoaspartate(D-aspartate) O-methyltransferase [Spirochaetales bacterium]|jgi:protein-L-isoaspartate(D-aspartate) O-methyltransferase|nr:protein-L-isoaspartate(D-aspartate) O-methyltransferase [Spirochaetales bacterium]
MEPKSYWDIADSRVLEAIRKVPRHKFVPENLQSVAEDDRPLPIGYGQTISQPYIVAYMSDQLELRSHHTVLEVGTGSGYQTAVLAELVSHVYTVECLSKLSAGAVKILTMLGYQNITAAVGDGRKGYRQAAPFDRIIVTAASEDIPQVLVEQLAVGGRMLLPLGSSHGTQYLYACRKLPTGQISTQRVLGVRFVPLV